MRITQGQVIQNLLYDLRQAGERLQRSEMQLSSLQKINRISDDPVGSVSALRLRANIDSVDMYISNAEDAAARLDVTETTLDVLSEILFSVKALAIQANTGSLSGESRLALAQQVDALIRHAVDIANESFAGKQLFGGHASDTKPAAYVLDNDSVTSVSIQNNPGAIERQIGRRASLQVNYSAEQVFGIENAGVFDDLLSLRDAVETGDSNALALLQQQIEGHFDRVLGLRTDAGAKLNRLALDIKKHQAERLMLMETLSSIVDTDVAETVVNVKAAEYAYEATLAVGARIVMPSLLDFLK